MGQVKQELTPPCDGCACRDDEIKLLRGFLQGLEPSLDAILCYASTIHEHEPNRIVKNVREYLKSEENKP